MVTKLFELKNVPRNWNTQNSYNSTNLIVATKNLFKKAKL